MDNPNLKMAHEIADAASRLEQQRTGHVPNSVIVALSDEILVVTVHEALTPAEKALARTPAGATQLQDFHNQLFSSSSDPLRLEINRISGRLVRQATAEVEPKTGSVVHAFTTGSMVQVFLLATSTPGLGGGENKSVPKTGSDNGSP